MQQATTTGTGKYEALLERCRSLAPVPTAVAYPCEASALAGAVEAAQKKLIVPILVGPAAKIAEIAKAAGLDLGGLEIIDVPDARAAAEKAVALVREGRAEVLMKGSLHTDELLVGGRLPRQGAADRPPHQPRLPDGRAHLPQGADRHRRRDQHRPDAGRQGGHLPERDRPGDRRSGVETPKVAILAAVETVNSKMPATLDAAALCKMADRGQIKGGLLDGPLAFDNAISKEAAKTKGITSEVAGDPDILLAPDLEAGNILAKQLSFLANADSAGLVLGARVPIILTSRADSVRSRIASCAVAVLVAHARRSKP